MKRIILSTLTFCLFLTASSQTAERKWNIGIAGGTSEYNGDKGNGFFDFNSKTLFKN